MRKKGTDQRLCFRYIKGTIHLLLLSQISSFQPVYLSVQAGLWRTWLETQKTCFLESWLKLFLIVGFQGLFMSYIRRKPCPEVIKRFSCSAQLRLKFILLINVKMPTAQLSILTFISRITGFGDQNHKFQFICAISVFMSSIYEQFKFHS